MTKGRSLGSIPDQPGQQGNGGPDVSLRYAVLALLTAEPMTGYELVQYFDATVGLTWAASHSQLYPELRRMEAEGLLSGDTVPRGQRAHKRVYNITPRGEEEFRAWVGSSLPYSPERNAHRLKILYGEFTDLKSVRRLLKDHIDYYTRRHSQWSNLRDAIRDEDFHLLQVRLKNSPPELRRRIIAFKEIGLDGNIALAEAEVAWARRGLEIIAELEREESAGKNESQSDNT